MTDASTAPNAIPAKTSTRKTSTTKKKTNKIQPFDRLPQFDASPLHQPQTSGCPILRLFSGEGWENTNLNRAALPCSLVPHPPNLRESNHAHPEFCGHGYSIFGIGVDRRHYANWLFPQEKATFQCS